MKRKHSHKRLHLGEIELNLVPMLDLFLSLIPFLLISAVFLNYGGLFVEAPSFAPANTTSTPTPEEKANTQEINLLFRVEGSQVKVSGYTKGFIAKLPEVQGEFEISNQQGLRDFIAKTMASYSKIVSVLFKASPTTKYQDAVSVLNIVRATKVSPNVVLAVRSIE